MFKLIISSVSLFLSAVAWYSEVRVKLTMDIHLAWYSEVTQSCNHDAIIYIVLIYTMTFHLSGDTCMFSLL